MTEVVATTEFRSADDFLEALMPRAPTFGESYFADDVIFRGHSNSSWSLLPSAFRRNSFESVDIPSGPDPRNNCNQVRAEALALMRFFTVADRSGMPLPEDSQSLRKELRQFADFDPGSNRGVENWPPPSVLALMAVAQHHGIPTRLLDWSWSAKVSAYFAASGAARDLRREGKARPSDEMLCVWAMTKSLFDVAAIMPQGEENPKTVELVTTPAAGNPNLHAQRGLFLLYRPPSSPPTHTVDVRPWDEVLPEAYSFMSPMKFLYKLLLPVSQAPRLLRLLAIEGVDGATIFPGFDGVVRSMKELKCWESSSEYHKARKRL
jgi:hypothetical protein